MAPARLRRRRAGAAGPARRGRRRPCPATHAALGRRLLGRRRRRDRGRRPPSSAAPCSPARRHADRAAAPSSPTRRARRSRSAGWCPHEHDRGRQPRHARRRHAGARRPRRGPPRRLRARRLGHALLRRRPGRVHGRADGPAAAARCCSAAGPTRRCESAWHAAAGGQPGPPACSRPARSTSSRGRPGSRRVAELRPPQGDAVETVADLKARDGGQPRDPRQRASWSRPSSPHGLIDALLLTIHPLVLGCGRRLFAGEARRPVQARGVEADDDRRADHALRGEPEAGRPARPCSVWLVAALISTSTSSPGAASPLKFTTLLWRVRPRRREASVREVPSTSTSSVRPTKRCARSRARRWIDLDEALHALDATARAGGTRRRRRRPRCRGAASR